MSLDVRLIRLPNCTDYSEFDALAAEPGVDMTLVDAPEQLGQPDLIVLPGTEKTIPDLEWLRSTGLEAAVRAVMTRGSLLFGICGGFQMMGEALRDPEHREGPTELAMGMRLFDLDTTFAGAYLVSGSGADGRAASVTQVR